MEIREATERDIPSILAVLKASLGEVSSRKTENVWRFKHVDSPFGKSLILVAVENQEIVGVRAFMRWQWQQHGNLNKCYRAVDTATHPDHQGKGVFKKLTLKAIEIAKEEQGDFIFNTPNEQSLPGYLKMGWEKVGQLRVKIKPTLPIYWLSKGTTSYSVDKNIGNSEIGRLCEDWNNSNRKSGKVFTPKSAEYLSWRYENNALQDYQVYSSVGFYIAGYVKQRKYFKELRIVEVIAEDEKSMKEVSKIVKNWIKKFGATFVSISDNAGLFKNVKILGNFGPVLTVRKLNVPEKEYRELLQLQTFNYTLGDLELF